MTQEWKPLDRAMVEIKSIAPGAGYAEVSFPGAFAGYAIPVDCLSPLPLAMTAEDRAVIEAAERWWKKATAGNIAALLAAIAALLAAIAARAAKLAPPDPVAELRAKYEILEDKIRIGARVTLADCLPTEAALAAVEAARGKAP